MDKDFICLIEQYGKAQHYPVTPQPGYTLGFNQNRLPIAFDPVTQLNKFITENQSVQEALAQIIREDEDIINAISYLIENNEVVQNSLAELIENNEIIQESISNAIANSTVIQQTIQDYIGAVPETYNTPLTGISGITSQTLQLSSTPFNINVKAGDVIHATASVYGDLSNWFGQPSINISGVAVGGGGVQVASGNYNATIQAIATATADGVVDIRLGGLISGGGSGTLSVNGFSTVITVFKA